MLTWADKNKDDEMIDGVHVIKICSKEDGIPGLRFFCPRWTSLVRAMNKSGAAIFYQNCGEYVTGQVALWCKARHRRFVYSIASDADCDVQLPAMKTIRERWLYRFGLTNADAVIAQTNIQKEMLNTGWGISAEVIPMPCAGPGESEYEPPILPSHDQVHCVWVGRIVPLKRLELLLDLAERFPDVTFEVAGKPDKIDEYINKLFERARSIDNVKMLGMIQRDQMGRLYKRASLLINTSTYEGLPNTFLEAWSYGLPVVSTVDPDGVFSKDKLGLKAENIDSLEENVKILIGRPDIYSEMSKRCRNYFLDNHTLDASMNRFQRLLSTVNEKS